MGSGASKDNTRDANDVATTLNPTTQTYGSTGTREINGSPAFVVGGNDDSKMPATTTSPSAAMLTKAADGSANSDTIAAARTPVPRAPPPRSNAEEADMVKLLQLVAKLEEEFSGKEEPSIEIVMEKSLLEKMQDMGVRVKSVRASNIRKYATAVIAAGGLLWSVSNATDQPMQEMVSAVLYLGGLNAYLTLQDASLRVRRLERGQNDIKEALLVLAKVTQGLHENMVTKTYLDEQMEQQTQGLHENMVTKTYLDEQMEQQNNMIAKLCAAVGVKVDEDDGGILQMQQQGVAVSAFDVEKPS